MRGKGDQFESYMGKGNKYGNYKDGDNKMAVQMILNEMENWNAHDIAMFQQRVNMLLLRKRRSERK